MRYRKNMFAYVNFLGTLILIMVILAYYFEYHNIVIVCLVLLAVMCIRQCVAYAKHKNEIQENDNRLMFTLSNQMFGIAIIVMNLCVHYMFK